MHIKGIAYDTGVNYDPHALSRDFWHPKAVGQDMKVIANELGCTAVAIFGTKHENACVRRPNWPWGKGLMFGSSRGSLRARRPKH